MGGGNGAALNAPITISAPILGPKHHPASPPRSDPTRTGADRLARLAGTFLCSEPQKSSALPLLSLVLVIPSSRQSYNGLSPKNVTLLHFGHRDCQSFRGKHGPADGSPDRSRCNTTQPETCRLRFATRQARRYHGAKRLW